MNDRLGHHTSDTVLIMAVKILKQSTKGEALVAESGGGEFPVLVSC